MSGTGSYVIPAALSWSGSVQGQSVALSFSAGSLASPTPQQQFVLDNYLVPQGLASNPAGQTGAGSSPVTAAAPIAPPAAGSVLTADGMGGQLWTPSTGTKTKRACMAIGGDGAYTTSSTNQYDWIQRNVINLPVTTTRWRLRVSTYNAHLWNPTAAMSLYGIALGTPVLDGTGNLAGGWQGTMANVQDLGNGGSVLASGADYVTPWFTAPSQQIQADTPRAISYGLNCPNLGIPYGYPYNGISTYGSLGSYGSGYTNPAAIPAGGSSLNAMMADVRFEYETLTSLPHGFFNGDSWSADYQDDGTFLAALRGPGSGWIGTAAMRERFIYTNAAVGGQGYGFFASPSSYAYTRFADPVTGAMQPFDFGVMGSTGINEAIAGLTLNTFQAQFLQALSVLQGFGIKNVQALVPPQVPYYNSSKVSSAVAAGVNQISLSNKLGANSAVTLSANNLANYEAGSVTSQTGLGPFLSLLAANTAHPHSLGEVVLAGAGLNGYSYANWIRTMPNGIDALIDADEVLSMYGDQLAEQYKLYGSGGYIHPDTKGKERLSRKLILKKAS